LDGGEDVEDADPRAGLVIRRRHASLRGEFHLCASARGEVRSNKIAVLSS
jgi:hypothetical protein